MEGIVADDRDIKKGIKGPRIKFQLKGGIELPHDLNDLVQFLHYKGVVPDSFAIGILEQGLYYRGALPDPFRDEAMQKMANDLQPRLLQTLPPEYLGFDYDPSLGQFYSRARKGNFQLCSLSDACRFAIEDAQDLGNETIYIGMMPFMRSDKTKHILTLKNNQDGVTRMEGLELLEEIWLGDKFLFRVR